MKKTMTYIMAAVAALVVVSGAAQAATVDNTSLRSPPGVYYGTGNGGSNVHWTVTTDPSGAELGVTAIERGVGASYTPVGNVYSVPTGGVTRAIWNLNFSVNLAGTGLTLGQVTPTLMITNLGNGNILSFNPFTGFPDNSAFDGTNTRNGNVSGQQATAADIGFQNSENFTFSEFNALVFNRNANDTYKIVLSMVDSNTQARYQDVTAFIQVGDGVSQTPLPAALPLFASGVFGIGGLSFWRRKKAAKLAA